MIFVGNQRGGAKNLANHLMNARDNDHVTVHDVRGFTSDTVHGAFNEAHALSRGTKCQQFLFSLSVNPPIDQNASTEDFENAIHQAEDKLGLTDQSRVIVFHEKNGRRHAHAVWSRIDIDEMKAVQLSFTHRKLMDVSRNLHIEHGWKMPDGMRDSKLKDPATFTLDEWQKAKSLGMDAKTVKQALQEAWAVSDNKSSFEHALSDHGFILARGKGASFVAVDRFGGVHALGKKSLGVKVKDIRSRLGDKEDLQTVDLAQAEQAKVMEAQKTKLNTELEKKKQAFHQRIEKRKQNLIERQRIERKQLFDKIEKKQIEQSKKRQARFRAGAKGLWDRVRGQHKRIQEKNEKEALESMRRDYAMKDGLIMQQQEQRRQFEDIKQREEQRFKSTKHSFGQRTPQTQQHQCGRQLKANNLRKFEL